MNQYSGRIAKTMHNTAIGIIGQMATYILAFVYRTIFIMVLGSDYLGVQGLFSNILSILSLTELGIGSAVTFSLYKPLAENKQDVIKGIMGYYARIYKVIGITVAGIGISLTPFLNVFIKDSPNIPYLWMIYLLYLSDSVLSYFFSYKRSIIIADQKSYINTLNINVFIILRTFVQIILLTAYRNFILVLAVQMIFTFLSNITISNKANSMYPYLKEKRKKELDSKIKSDLIKKIRAMAYHQIGTVFVFGTDNLLISTFIGVFWVGIYSNYILIIGIITMIIQQFTQSVVAGIGNLVSTETIKKSKNTFDLLFFINFWIYSFCSICFLTLINPFIVIWIGSEFLFDSWIVVMIVINFYLSGMRQNILAFRNALGLFWYDRYKPIFEAIINIAASIILLNQLGIIGVFIGTSISTIATSFWVEPYIVFKYYFKNGIKKYFQKYIVYTLATILIGFFMHLLSENLFHGTLSSFIILFMMCLIVPNLLLCIIFFRTNEFKNSVSLIKQIIFVKKTNQQNTTEL